MNSKSQMHMMKRMEEKLKELMGDKAFVMFTNQIAKEAFRIEIENMAEGDFKDFVLTNFDEIVGAQEGGEDGHDKQSGGD